MKNLKSLALLLVCAPIFAGTAPIGVATSIGTVAINQAVVSGPTNLSDGSVLETTTTPSEIHLATGADVRLATRSAGTFYADHVQLDQGALRVGNFNGLKVNASQLEIGSDDPAAQAVIRFKHNNIEVASIGGAVNVMDSGLLTRVAAGTKMSFQQSGAETNPQAQPRQYRCYHPGPEDRQNAWVTRKPFSG